MTLRNRAGLQTQVDTLLADNTTGNITAADARSVLTDVVDSFELVMVPPFAAPSISSFSLAGQANAVDAGTVLTGPVTVNYEVTNPENVDGDLNLFQGFGILSTAVPADGSSFQVTFITITVGAGTTVPFVLTGRNTQGQSFSSSFNVRGRSPQDFIYFGTQPTSDASAFAFATESRADFMAGSQTVVIPTFTGSEFLVIAQRSNDPVITRLNIGGINQLLAFTRQAAAFTISGTNYDAWVSDNALIGSLVSGQTVEIVRT